MTTNGALPSVRSRAALHQVERHLMGLEVEHQQEGGDEGASPQSAAWAVIDAPVCFGLGGAGNGTLASLVGGTKKDVKKACPVLQCYSRAVHHLGELGSQRFPARTR